eukprot:g1388.t1
MSSSTRSTEASSSLGILLLPPSFHQKLYRAGFNDIQDIRKASVSALVKRLDISISRAQDLLDHCSALVEGEGEGSRYNNQQRYTNSKSFGNTALELIENYYPHLLQQYSISSNTNDAHDSTNDPENNHTTDSENISLNTKNRQNHHQKNQNTNTTFPGLSLSTFQLPPWIQTNVKGIDHLLGGGLRCGQLTEVCGLPGIGKTQFAMQLAVNAALTKRKKTRPHNNQNSNNLDNQDTYYETIYIDTEGSFMAERVAEMARANLANLANRRTTTTTTTKNKKGRHTTRHHEHSEQFEEQEKELIAINTTTDGGETSSALSVEAVLSRIHVFRAYDRMEHVACVNYLEEFIANRNKKEGRSAMSGEKESHGRHSNTGNSKILLVIVDSIAFHFRHDISDTVMRSRLLLESTRKLIDLANKFRLAVLLVNQVKTSNKANGSREGQSRDLHNNNKSSTIVNPYAISTDIPSVSLSNTQHCTQEESAEQEISDSAATEQESSYALQPVVKSGIHTSEDGSNNNNASRIITSLSAKYFGAGIENPYHSGSNGFVPALGGVYSHTIHSRLVLYRPSDRMLASSLHHITREERKMLRIARLTKSCSKPPGAVPFRITPDGLEDI